MRLLAWRSPPRVSQKKIRLLESYACARDCHTPKGWNRTKRAGRGCTRTDLPHVKWDVDAERLGSPRREHDASLYLGRPADKTLEGTVDLWPVNCEIPHEASDEGCPGGWYRTPFASSVLTYRRSRIEGGGRVENGFLRNATDQIWEAVLELEREEARAEAYTNEIASKIAQRRAKAGGSRGSGRR